MEELNQTMHGLDLTTPSLLFSAISLILLAYTNRFLSYASVVRSLKEKYDADPEADRTSLAQIRNFRIRLKLIRAMQTLGAGSLLFCLIAMFCIYNRWMVAGDITFGVGMVLLAASLVLCIIEVQISVEALELNLQSIKDRKKEQRDPTQGGSFRRLGMKRREGDDDKKEQKQQKEQKPREPKERNKGQQREQKPRAEREPQPQREQKPRVEQPARESVEEKPQQEARQQHEPRERRERRGGRSQQQARREPNTSAEGTVAEITRPEQSLPVASAPAESGTTE